jgi:2-hydroxychromene-2-carboxylate isomerase
LNSTDARAASATPATTDDMGGNHDGSMSGATFLYDVGSPLCWLAGERVAHVLGVVPVWQPVLGAGLPGGGSGATDRAAVDDAAAAQGLPPLRWPDPWPFDSELAMRAATFAKQSGRAVAFSLAAMRQAFAGGRDLSVPDNVLIAAAACELHPRALLKGVETAAVRNALSEATAAAAAQGVDELPAVVVGGGVFTGPRAVEDAAAA